MARIPTPKRLVSAPRALPIPEARGNLANVAAAGQVGQLSDQWNQHFYKVAVDNAERKGQEAANAFIFDKDPKTGQIIPPARPQLDGKLVPSIYDRAYYDRINTRYQTEILNQSEVQVSDLATKHQLDPEMFDSSINAYKSEVLKNVPEDLRGSVDTAISTQAVPFHNKIARDKAEVETQKSKNVAVARFEADLANMQQISENGGSMAEVMAAHDVLMRSIAATGDLFNESELYNFEQVVEQRLVYSSIARDLTRSGKPGALLSHNQVIQKVMDGTLMVNALGRERKISEILDEKELQQVAGQIQKYSSMFAQREQLRTQAMKDAWDMNVFVPAVTQAMQLGIPMDQEEILAAIKRNSGNPDFAMYMYKGMQTVHGVAEKKQNQVGADQRMLSQVELVRATTTPEQKEQILAATGENIDDRAGLVEFLIGEGRSAEASQHLAIMQDHITAFKAQTVGADQKNAMETLSRLTAAKADNKASGVPESNAIADQGFMTKGGRQWITKKRQEAAAAMNGVTDFSWYGNTEGEVNMQFALAKQGAEDGILDDGMIDLFNSIPFSAATDVTGKNILLFNAANSNPRSAGVLEDALGEKKYDALVELSRHVMSNTQYGELPSKEIIDDVLRDFDPSMDPIVDSRFQKPARDAALWSNSTNAEEMDKGVYQLAHGEKGSIWGPDILTPGRDFTAAFSKNLERALWHRQGDMEKASQEAMSMTKRDYIEDPYSLTGSRRSAIYKDGMFDLLNSKQRGVAPLEMVHQRNSILAQYPEVTVDNGLTRDVLEYEMIRTAREKYPDIDWQPGINLVTVRATDDSRLGGAQFHLYGFDKSGNQVMITDPQKPFNFEPTHRILRGATIQQQTEAADIRREIRAIQDAPGGTEKLAPLYNKLADVLNRDVRPASIQ